VERRHQLRRGDPFIFADLIVLPVLDIYRRYYGWRMAGFLLASFYATMVTAGLAVELVFGALSLISEQRAAKVVEASISWNYTTVLNLGFLALAAVLVLRFLRTGGPAMLRMMSSPQAHDDHGHVDDPQHHSHE
jgi:uncharacterized membrane protein YraQ (UPF0718 family)